MTFNYFFEVAACLICIILSVDIKIKHQLYRLDAKFFIHILRLQGLLSTINIITCLCLNNPGRFPYQLITGLLVVHYILQALCMSGMIMFVLSYPDHSIRDDGKFIVIAGAVLTLSIVLAVLTPAFGLLFRISPAGVYTEGSFSILVYICWVLVAAIMIIYPVIKRNLIQPRELNAFICSAFMLAGMIHLQANHYVSLTLGLATAIVLLIFYTSLENPATYIDKRTNCNNLESFRMYLGQWDPKKDIYSIEIVRIHQLATIGIQYGRDAGNHIFGLLADFLKSTAGTKRVFRIDDFTFLVVKRGTMAMLDPIEAKLAERFNDPWKLQDGGLISAEKQTAMLQYPEHFSDYTSCIEMVYHLITLLGSQGNVLIKANDDIMSKKRRVKDVEEALKHALSSETLEVYYQPIFDDDQKKIIALEALSRLTDPLLGFIPPDEFVTVAEDTGLIYDMGIYVFKKVCRFINTGLMRKSNSTVSAVEINLSPLQLSNPKTIPEFKRIMKHFDIPGNMLNFELTESAAIGNPEMLLASMTELQELGCCFSLDDYGTGYSNISYMVQFPFDFIKFDKNLVWSYFKEPAARIIMQSQFDMIISLGKEIIAEGIEDMDFIRELREQNVRFYQGYYFSKAIPERELLVYLDAPLPELP